MKLLYNFISKVERYIDGKLPSKYLAQYNPNIKKEEVLLTDSINSEFFFGYHDRSPFQKDGNLILSHRLIKNNLELGYFLINEGIPSKFNVVSKSNAYSRQQGAMLQWDYLKDNKTISFNTIENGIAKNVSIDIASKDLVKEFDFPFYCMSEDCKFALSCNFFQLARMRPGYGIENIESNQKIDIKNDGIWIIDREKDSLLLLASYIELSEVAKKKATQKTYLNHLSFSPNGKKIVWFLINEEPNSREIIFQGMDLSNKSKIFNIESQRLTSHFCWIDNDRIFTSNRDQNLNWKYSIYNLENGTREDLNLKSKFDGHPMYNSLSNQVIIDTTPDSNGFQHLLSIKMLDLSSQQLGKWKSPLKFSGPDRCDLHPRWKEDATAVSIDTIHEDKRCQKIIFLDINELLA
tara:strand:- start:4899 stop:6116 length:1218 start_codon:yes stop_codon:yes gene_type:complete